VISHPPVNRKDQHGERQRPDERSQKRQGDDIAEIDGEGGGGNQNDCQNLLAAEPFFPVDTFASESRKLLCLFSRYLKRVVFHKYFVFSVAGLKVSRRLAKFSGFTVSRRANV
jgi:hypothetical protein